MAPSRIAASLVRQFLFGTRIGSVVSTSSSISSTGGVAAVVVSVAEEMRSGAAALMDALQRQQQQQQALMPELAGAAGLSHHLEDGAETGVATLEDALRGAVWQMAVPKDKKSHAKTRQRQHAATKALVDVQHFYPCPKCDKGLLKLRHHLCPCDLETAGAKNIVRVHYDKPYKKPAEVVPDKEAGSQ